jgi:hypothetical protein
MENIAAYLRSCEEALLDPAVRRDRARVDALLDQDFQEFGSSGRIWTRAQTLELLATETYAAPSMTDFECVLLSEAVALLTYRTVRAQPGAQDSALRSSVWTNRSGTWRIRFHQGTRQL